MTGKNWTPKIGIKELRPFQSIAVVVEVASSHDGKMEVLEELIHAAARARANAIKFQILNADDLLVPAHSKYLRLKEIEFEAKQWRHAVDLANSLGLSVIAEPFDEKSLDLALDLNVAAIKIPTSDLTNFFFFEKLARFEKPVLLSVGAATEEEILFSVNHFKEQEREKLILMHGFQNFPTKIEDTYFSFLEYLRTKFPYPVGFADHVDADTPMAVSIPLAAIGFGATILEKHLTPDRSKKGRDYFSALNPDEFVTFVQQVRLMEKAYGTLQFGTSEAESSYRKVMKKKVVARHAIAKGQRITMKDVSFKRTEGEGLTPNQWEQAIGNALKDIPQDSLIRVEDIRK